jgi:hypothetical protein
MEIIISSNNPAELKEFRVFLYNSFPDLSYDEAYDHSVGFNKEPIVSSITFTLLGLFTVQSLQQAYFSWLQYKKESQKEENDHQIKILQITAKNEKDSVPLEDNDFIESKNLEELLQRIYSNTENIKDILSQFIQQFAQIKQEQSLDLDSKILKLEQLIDKTQIRNMSEYEQKLELIIPKFNQFQPNTRLFLSVGLYLLDYALDNLTGDFSAAALQFCRALEFELKIKIFEGFKASLPTPAPIYPNENALLIKGDRLTFGLFLNFINNNGELTLNQMTHIIEKTPSSLATKLMTDFNDFLTTPTNKFYDIAIFTQKIMELMNKNYRNKSAHTQPLPKQDAEDSKKIAIESLRLFMY